MDHAIRVIFNESTSRRLLCFLILNLSFGFVELMYGVWSNSLGLITDAFHMFFDSTALLVGLIASVVCHWKPNKAFTFGYARVEIIAGFVNSISLLCIAFFIFAEAVERAFEPPEVKHERLFIVSAAGFFINLIGIFIFHHGHAHSGVLDREPENHSRRSRDSQLGHYDIDSSRGSTYQVARDYEYSQTSRHPDVNLVASQTSRHRDVNLVASNHTGNASDNDRKTTITDYSSQAHTHSHSGYSDRIETNICHSESRIMYGVFLHVLADTLGSVGVMISSLMISHFGLFIADPLCSILISVLIVLSVLPLINDSLGILMQRTPKELDLQLPDYYQKISRLDGVYSIKEFHFWTLCTDVYVGTIRIDVTNLADSPYLINRIQDMFIEVGVKHLNIQIDHADIEV